MNTVSRLIFPDLILLSDYSGNFDRYIQALYQYFIRDFVKTQPFYQERKITAKRYPEENGMHKTFYHITHEGADESNRTPDLRRMERIQFPRFVIEQHQHPEILIWENKRKADTRIVMFNENESYVVIIADRRSYFLLITAYVVDSKHRKAKLLKEYEAFKNAETA
jgi:hypothetical protein